MNTITDIARYIFDKYPLYIRYHVLKHKYNGKKLDPVFLLSKYIKESNRFKILKQTNRSNNTLFSKSLIKILEYNIPMDEIKEYFSEQTFLNELFDLVILSLNTYYDEVQQLRTECKDCEEYLYKINTFGCCARDDITFNEYKSYRRRVKKCKICASKPTIISNEKLFPQQSFIEQPLINCQFSKSQMNYIMDNIEKQIKDDIIEEENKIVLNYNRISVNLKSNHSNTYTQVLNSFQWLIDHHSLLFTSFFVSPNDYE